MTDLKTEGGFVFFHGFLADFPGIFLQIFRVKFFFFKLKLFKKNKYKYDQFFDSAILFGALEFLQTIIKRCSANFPRKIFWKCAKKKQQNLRFWSLLEDP